MSFEQIIHNILKKSDTPWSFYREEVIAPFDQILDDAMSNLEGRPVVSYQKGSYPKVNVIDRLDAVVIEAELAGWKKEDVSITVDKGQLQISGVSKNTDTNEKTKYIRRELKRSSFQRTFILGDSLNHDEVSAEFNEGFLTITIAKKSATTASPKRAVNIK